MVKHKPIKGKRSLKNEKNYKFNHVGGHSRAAICTFFALHNVLAEDGELTPLPVPTGLTELETEEDILSITFDNDGESSLYQVNG